MMGFCVSSLLAQDEEEIPLGLEAVTGFRSEYVHRGVTLAQRTMDFQLEGELTLSKDLYLGFGAWYATELSQSEFSELGTRLSLVKDFEKFQWRGAIKYRDYSDDSAAVSGFELDSKLQYFLPSSDALSQNLSVLASYDTGADGWYGALEYNLYPVLSEDAYLAFKFGVSAVEDYYGRSGFNDFYARFSGTYNINKFISVTPFVGTSIQFDSKHRDSVYAGIWFETSF